MLALLLSCCFSICSKYLEINSVWVFDLFLVREHKVLFSSHNNIDICCFGIWFWSFKLFFFSNPSDGFSSLSLIPLPLFFHPSTLPSTFPSGPVPADVTMMTASQMRRLMDGGCLTWRKRSTVRGSALTGSCAWREKVSVLSRPGKGVTELNTNSCLMTAAVIKKLPAWHHEKSFKCATYCCI